METMPEFSQEELVFIGNILGQLTFKAGQSQQVVMCESLIEKIKVVLPQPEQKEDNNTEKG